MGKKGKKTKGRVVVGNNVSIGPNGGISVKGSWISVNIFNIFLDYHKFGKILTHIHSENFKQKEDFPKLAKGVSDKQFERMSKQ